LLYLPTLLEGLPPSPLLGEGDFVFEVEYDTQFVLLYGIRSENKKGDLGGTFS